MGMLTLRAALESDLEAATGLFVEGALDLARRNGLPPVPGMTVEVRLPWYRHVLKTGIFRVAERDGQIVALANAIVRDGQWFLAGFWTRPGAQRQGIGRPLLAQVFEEGRQKGTRLEFTWSSIDFTAVGTYFRLGLLPRTQVFALAGPVARLRLEPPHAGYGTRGLTSNAAEGWDRRVRETARPQDQGIFGGDGASSREVLAPNGEPCGYFRVRRGTIGPAAWSDSAHGEAVMSLALAQARDEGAADLRVVVPGSNHSALRAAVAAGLHVAGAAHLLGSAPVAGLDRYVPSGPILF